MWGLEDWHRCRFTALAGSDAHGQLPSGTCPTQLGHGESAELAGLLGQARPGLCAPVS